MVQNIQHRNAVNLQSIHQNVPVTSNYNVYFTTGVFNFKNPSLAQVIAGDDKIQPKQVLAIADEELLRSRCRLLWQLDNYSKRYPDKFAFICEPLIIPREEVKSYINWREQIHQLIEPVKLDRECYLLAIGGKDVLDLADYIVATTYRQINLIRIPSTLMAANYSGIGVENRISDFTKKTNIFTPPYAVFNDFAFLKSLDECEWRGSILEAIKVALMLDADFFEFLREKAQALIARDMDTMQQVIHGYAKLCLTHFINSSNPFILKTFSPFDFGDWAVPKLEKLTGNRLHRSEALAIGIALDSTYSYLLGMLSRLEWKKILTTLIMFSFDLYVPELEQQVDKLKNHCSQSQSWRALAITEDGLSLKLPECIGKGKEVYEINLSLYRQAIMMLQEFVENNHKPVMMSTNKTLKHQPFESKRSNVQRVSVEYSAK